MRIGVLENCSFALQPPFCEPQNAFFFHIRFFLCSYFPFISAQGGVLLCINGNLFFTMLFFCVTPVNLTFCKVPFFLRGALICIYILSVERIY